MQHRKSRPDSFKKDAVRRVMARGSKTVTDIAKELGVSPSMLRRGVRGGAAVPGDVRLERARREWLEELAGPKYGKWWLHKSPIPHADLVRVLNRTAEDDAAELRARVLEWAASHVEEFEERKRAKRAASKARALVRHYRVMIKAAPAFHGVSPSS